MEKPFQIAMIGCGWAGARHARAFAACGASIAWAVDVNASRAEALKDLLGGEPRVAGDYRDALRDAGVDAVDICLPHDLHGEAGVAAAQAGKHILCEKPIAATLEEAPRNRPA